MSGSRINRSTTALTLVHGASATTVASTAATPTTGLILNGQLQEYIITTPAAVDGSATVTVNLIDQGA